VERFVAYVPWCVAHHSQYFGLISLYDFCVERFRAAPQLYTIGPYGLEDYFI